jgi:hypothetical protein
MFLIRLPRSALRRAVIALCAGAVLVLGSGCDRIKSVVEGGDAKTRDNAFVNSLGMRFVEVPITGGPTTGQRVLFSAWLTRKQDYNAFVAETGRDKEPHEKVKVAAQALNVFPQNWMPFKALPQAVSKSDPNSQAPAAPATNVNWGDAVAFCTWLTMKERASGAIPSDAEYRLPTDHEWSCAVGIGEREDASAGPKAKSGLIEGYEWGTAWPPPRNCANLADGYKVDDFPGFSPVGGFGANRFGLYDMAGNARQWCSDLYDPAKEIVRVVRGASWNCSGETECRLSTRHYQGPAVRSDTISFRPVLVFPRTPAIAAAGDQEPGLTVREWLETPELTAMITVKCQGRRVRQEVSTSAAGDAVSLFDLDAGSAFIVFPAKKLALSTTPEALTASSVFSEKLLTSGKPWTKPAPSGTAAQIGSWKTRVYTSSWGETPATLWVSDEVSDWQAIRSHLLRLGQAMTSLGFDPVSLDVPGLAVKTTLRLDAGKIEVTLLSVRREQHTESEFSIPPEYAVQPLRTGPQRQALARVAQPPAPRIPTAPAPATHPSAPAPVLATSDPRPAGSPSLTSSKRSSLDPGSFRVTSVSLGPPNLAIINGRSLGEGEEIPGTAGVRIEQIGEDAVALRVGAERMTIPVRSLSAKGRPR